MEIGKETIIILALLGILCLAYVGYSTYQSYIKIQSKGQIKTVNLKVFKDAQCTIPLTEINWGQLTPASTTTYTAYILNSGNIEGILNMTTENWNPSNANNYITLNWDAEGKTITPNQIMAITFTLTISPYIQNITDFSFEIKIIIYY